MFNTLEKVITLIYFHDEFHDDGIQSFDESLQCYALLCNYKLNRNVDNTQPCLAPLFIQIFLDNRCRCKILLIIVSLLSRFLVRRKYEYIISDHDIFAAAFEVNASLVGTQLTAKTEWINTQVCFTFFFISHFLLQIFDIFGCELFSGIPLSYGSLF